MIKEKEKDKNTEKEKFKLKSVSCNKCYKDNVNKSSLHYAQTVQDLMKVKIMPPKN